MLSRLAGAAVVTLSLQVWVATLGYVLLTQGS
jgi:hypothetical protein